MGFEQTFDAATAGVALLNRELFEIDKRIFERSRPPITTIEIPSVPGLSEGTEYYGYDILQANGLAKVVANYGTDIPLVEVAAEPHNLRMKSLKLGAKWSEDDLLAFATAGRPLDQSKLNEALRGCEVAIDQVTFLGDSANALHGMLSHPNIPRVLSPFKWDSNATADQILALLSQCITTISRLTRGVERPTRLALPPFVVDYLGLLPRSATTDTSVLAWFLDNVRRQIPGFEIRPVHWLTGAGVGGSNVGVFYDPDPMKLEKALPMPPPTAPVRNCRNGSSG